MSTDTRELADRLIQELGLAAAWVTSRAVGIPAEKLLAPAVGDALQAANLQRGDALLVSSGTTLHAVSQQDLPALPGIVLAPTVGGWDEPKDHYQWESELTDRAKVIARAMSCTDADQHNNGVSPWLRTVSSPKRR